MAKLIKTILPLYIVFFITINGSAGTVAGFGGSTEITQILNNVQLMQSYGQQVLQVQNQISQIANQLQMYQTMITNMQSLAGQPFQSAMQTLVQLRNAINQATNISYTFGNVDQYFQRLNPNYATLFQGNNYANQQAYWRTNVDQYCMAALKTANFEMSSAQTEAQLLNNLSQRSSSALGQKQAIQAGNEIAVAMIAQLDRLKLLTAAQTQSQSVYLSQEKAEKEADEMSVRQLYQYNPASTNPNDNATF